MKTIVGSEPTCVFGAPLNRTVRHRRTHETTSSIRYSSSCGRPLGLARRPVLFDKCGCSRCRAHLSAEHFPLVALCGVGDHPLPCWLVPTSRRRSYRRVRLSRGRLFEDRCLTTASSAA